MHWNRFVFTPSLLNYINGLWNAVDMKSRRVCLRQFIAQIILLWWRQSRRQCRRADTCGEKFAISFARAKKHINMSCVLGWSWKLGTWCVTGSHTHRRKAVYLWLCDIELWKKACLKVHLSVNAGEKLYKCSASGKIFVTASAPIRRTQTQLCIHSEEN